MAHFKQLRGRPDRFFLATILAMALAAAGLAHAQGPHPGDVQKLSVITISMQVGSMEKETRQVTYTPPPGWYVRSHRVHCTLKNGNSSFSVSTVPRDWNWASEAKVEESYKTLIALAAKAANSGLHAKFALERDQLLTEIRKVRSTHHALVVDATARGEGFWRAGGGLELTVVAEIVFVGTDETLNKVIIQGQANLGQVGSTSGPLFP
jgi:hypothetical protein